MNIRHSLESAIVLLLVLVSSAQTVSAFPGAPQLVADDAPEGMVVVPGGVFEMGFDHAYQDETPVHRVRVKPFLLDATEVTNRQFAAFVEATGHVTQAERDGYSWAFVQGADDFQMIEDANWRQPEGAGSSYLDQLGHPVVCVSWHDAAAFAEWAGKRLVTEAEWEYAARGGCEDQFVADVVDGIEPHGGVSDAGDPSSTKKEPVAANCCAGKVASRTLTNEIRIEANVWRGEWPTENRLEDDFFYTAPGGHYPANAYGVHDMIGNVWEWTADWYDAAYYESSPVDNPSGPTQGTLRVARGGSWFCSTNYCGAYSTHYRGSSPPEHTFNNVGFRCASDLPDVAVAARKEGDGS